MAPRKRKPSSKAAATATVNLAVASAKPPKPTKKHVAAATPIQAPEPSSPPLSSPQSQFGDEILQLWGCKSEKCSNEKNYCWFSRAGLHYVLSATQTKQWASARTTGDATAQNPPAYLVTKWVNEQGAVDRTSTSNYQGAEDPYGAVYGDPQDEYGNADD